MPRKLNPIEIAALRIAAFPPLKRSSTRAAYVKWDYIITLRETLEAHGIDWRKIHHMMQAEDEAARQRLRDAHTAAGKAQKVIRETKEFFNEKGKA